MTPDLPSPPVLIGAQKAAEYAAQKHGVPAVRQTILNWIKTGANQKQLRGVRRGRRWFTTERWVDAFLEG